MTNFAIAMLLYVLIIPVLPIVYGLSRSNAAPRKNILLGVTLPSEALATPEVTALRRQYLKRINRLYFILLLLSFVPFLYTKYFSIVFTLLVTWVFLVTLLPFPLATLPAYRRLKMLKTEHYWQSAFSASTVVDLTAAAQPPQEIHPAWFMPPLAISLIPVVYPLLHSGGPNTVFWLSALNLLLLVGFFLIYRIAFHQKSEVVGDQSSTNTTLTRIRQRLWGKLWLLVCWFTALYSLASALLLNHLFWYILVLTGYTFALLGTVTYVEFKVRRAQETLSRHASGPYPDEDRHWLWGTLYYNPNDRRIMVNERVGIGSTINLATKTGKIILLTLPITLIITVACCIWIIALEFTPVTLSHSPTQVSAHHTGLQFAIPIIEVESAELLQELPAIHRRNGSNLSTAYTGKFYSENYGDIRVCLNPQSPPFLLLTTQDGSRYLLGSSLPAEAQSAWQVLQASTALSRANS